MVPFISYWYLQSPGRFYAAYLALMAALEDQLAVRDMLRNLRQPLFQDYTWQGRAIGFGIRLLRILGGAFVYLVASIAYAFVYLLWLLAPAVCLVSLVGSLFGPANPSIILQ